MLLVCTRQNAEMLVRGMNKEHSNAFHSQVREIANAHNLFLVLNPQ